MRSPEEVNLVIKGLAKSIEIGDRIGDPMQGCREMRHIREALKWAAGEPSAMFDTLLEAYRLMDRQLSALEKAAKN